MWLRLFCRALIQNSILRPVFYVPGSRYLQSDFSPRVKLTAGSGDFQRQKLRGSVPFRPHLLRQVLKEQMEWTLLDRAHSRLGPALFFLMREGYLCFFFYRHRRSRRQKRTNLSQPRQPYFGRSCRRHRMHIHERTPSTATRLGRDPTLARESNTSRPPTEENSCCPAFFESPDVGHGRSPCDDFHRYVCARNGSSAATFRWDTWNALEALSRSHDHPTALSGSLLRSLHGQCEDLLDRGPLQFVREMTPLVLQTAQLPRSASNADQALLLMAYISLKLNHDSPVHFSVSDAVHPTIEVNEKIADLVLSFALFNRTCSECVDEALRLIGDHTGSPVLREELFAFEVDLEDFPNSTDSSCSPGLFRLHGAGTAWDKMCQDIFDVPFSDVRMLCITRPSRIHAAFKRFAAPDRKSVPLASIVVHLLATIYHRLNSVDTSIASPYPEHRCLFQDDFPYLWTQLYSEVLVTSAKNRHIKDIFANVTTALPGIASAANIVAPEVDTRLVEHVQSLRISLPVRGLPRQLEPPRVSTHNFSAQFLAFKEYEFRLEVLRRRRHFPRQLLTGDPVYVSNGWLVVTPLAYTLLDLRCKLPIDLPVVGVPMAKAVWSYLLDKENSWLVALLKNKTDSFSCLHGGDGNLTWRGFVVRPRKRPPRPAVRGYSIVRNKTKPHRRQRSEGETLFQPWQGSRREFFQASDALCCISSLTSKMEHVSPGKVAREALEVRLTEKKHDTTNFLVICRVANDDFFFPSSVTYEGFNKRFFPHSATYGRTYASETLHLDHVLSLAHQNATSTVPVIEKN
ncbi:hypothetical protein HPB48_019856 [Haemaphysalis longicornis]|uniref:Uncharacterized protein n=1 Tax=Haemaphysalis longicornis TaxID=44386 RepID=A0A9J6H0G2_HAELO|nr:hypothetical protein HPB48_019856 [Haemaphysalis longicornis]